MVSITREKPSTAALCGKYRVILHPQVEPKIKYEKLEGIAAQWCLLAWYWQAAKYKNKICVLSNYF